MRCGGCEPERSRKTSSEREGKHAAFVSGAWCWGIAWYIALATGMRHSRNTWRNLIDVTMLLILFLLSVRVCGLGRKVFL